MLNLHINNLIKRCCLHIWFYYRIKEIVKTGYETFWNDVRIIKSAHLMEIRIENVNEYINLLQTNMHNQNSVMSKQFIHEDSI